MVSWLDILHTVNEDDIRVDDIIVDDIIVADCRVADLGVLEDDYALPLRAALRLGDEGLVALKTTEGLKVTVAVGER